MIPLITVPFLLTVSLVAGQKGDFVDCTNDPDKDDSWCCVNSDCSNYLTVLTEKCYGNSFTAQCCDAQSNLINCYKKKCEACDNKILDCGLAELQATSTSYYCGDVSCTDIDVFFHEDCDNDYLCSCSEDWKGDCKKCAHKDYGCSCHAYDKHISCLQSEVQSCGSIELDFIFFTVEKEKHDICKDWEHDNRGYKHRFRHWLRNGVLILATLLI